MIDKTLIIIAVRKIFEKQSQVNLPGPIIEEKDTIRKILSADIKAWIIIFLIGILKYSKRTLRIEVNLIIG